MTLIPVDFKDDDVVFAGKKNRNFLVRKLWNHMPGGSVEIVGLEKDGGIIITCNHNYVMALEIGETWKQMKRLLHREGKDRSTWECPICCERPECSTLSTCGKCLNDMCMECFILGFEKAGGVIQCPWCRDLVNGQQLSIDHLAFACVKLRKEHGIKHPY